MLVKVQHWILMILKKDISYKIAFNTKTDKYLMKLLMKNKITLATLLEIIKKFSRDYYTSEILKGELKDRRNQKKRLQDNFYYKLDLCEIEIVKIGKRTNIYKKFNKYFFWINREYISYCFKFKHNTEN